MAYYPGDDFYQHLPDYYSQSLFFFGTNATLNVGDPYAFNFTYNQHYDGDDGNQHQRQRRPVQSAMRSTTSTPHSSPPFVVPPSAPDLPRSSPSPPPPPLESTPTPSESYIALSSIPSTTLSSPTRKLVVLDLNGTLLLRSPRPPRSARGQHHLGPAPRRVMPRPYLPALRSYFFAPSTRAWLDVMVWSSAQPHSVDDMLLHTFGHDRSGFVAVWARDTLGLAEDHYHRKVQTIKDLEKPWAALAPPEQGRASPSSVASSRQASPSPAVSSRHASPEPTWSSHSAATTILLDDSHAKAALQPYNHLCVREYTRAQRNADLAALGPQPPHTERAPPPALETMTSIGEEAADVHHPGKGHKRKRSKEQQQQQQRGEDEEGLDETLLAVIGILHAARLQSNIAGWLRASALIQPRPSLGGGAEWFDYPALMHQWALRGREAMHELGLVVEHGVKP
ncbi:hypothetical protein EDB87DRAFT_1684509 [Lactarius vividus]|nr:hypothetical protein EDB87DRAFT_1684509 [Lactarius vividus]